MSIKVKEFMYHSMVLMISLVIVTTTLTSCDPAKRLRIINYTNDDIILTEKELYPDHLFYDESSFPNQDVILSTDINHPYLHFYGIGGWSDDDQDIMVVYLDSLLSSKTGLQIKSTSELLEFGNSLMVYEFEEM